VGWERRTVAKDRGTLVLSCKLLEARVQRLTELTLVRNWQRTD